MNTMLTVGRCLYCGEFKFWHTFCRCWDAYSGQEATWSELWPGGYMIRATHTSYNVLHGTPYAVEFSITFSYSNKLEKSLHLIPCCTFHHYHLQTCFFMVTRHSCTYFTPVPTMCAGAICNRSFSLTHCIWTWLPKTLYGGQTQSRKRSPRSKPFIRAPLSPSVQWQIESKLNPWRSPMHSVYVMCIITMNTRTLP